MQILLQHIQLTNFKGIRSFSTSFGFTTNIHGDNATGKTSLFDAFIWLLFGKDSTDRKDFEVKTLDENNKVIPQIDHEVTAQLEVDGQPMLLKRVFKEKWVKRRGNAEPELQGNENLFFWNEVPVQLGEWQKKIGAIVDENLFKLITNTLYFNQLKWQDRRNVLMQLAGNITNDDVLDRLAADRGNIAKDVVGLLDVLNSGKPLEEYRRQLTAQKKLLNDALKSIPTRIDEATRSMPDVVDYSALEAQKLELQAELTKIDQALNDSSEALRQHQEGVNIKRHQAFAAQTKIGELQQVIKVLFQNDRHSREMAAQTALAEVNNTKASINSLLNSISHNSAPLSTYTIQLDRLRSEWAAVDAEILTFSEDQFCCPACKRPMDEVDVYAQRTTMEENFNTSKSERLSNITKRAGQIKESIAGIEKANTDQNTQLILLRSKLEAQETVHYTLVSENNRIFQNEEQELANKLSSDTEIIELQTALEKLQAEITQTTPVGNDNSEILMRKGNITRDIEYLNKQLGTKDHIERTQIRIQDLQKEERTLAQQIADLEKTEFQIEQFNKAKMDTLEARINGRFKMVKFKLFQTQINGGETECCETLINGVPFSDANNASKINAGLDIINTLCQHNNVYAPIFIDNAESVVSLIGTDSQTVRLVVTAGEKTLRVAA